MNNQSTPLIYLIILSVLIAISILAGLSFGAANIAFKDVLENVIGLSQPAENDFTRRILFELRLPRVLLAFLAGCGLALSGLVLQTVTRNPLADPYLFGISSGASFGVVVLIVIVGSGFGFAMSIAAFIGSLLAMLMLMVISSRQQSQQIESMLLAGVALSFLFSSFTSLLLYSTDPQAVTAILFWTLGSFARAQWQTLWFPAVVIISCMAIILSYRRQLNAMLLGDESATTLGINVKKFRLTMLIISSLITATLVAMCGGIGFVGLMIPHIVRFFVSQGTVLGLIITTISGGLFMIWVDILARTLLANQELPVGVITAASGSLFFLSLLYFRKNKAV